MVKTFHPENRLAKLIKLPGGVTLADAMVHANRNLASVRETCLAGVDEKIGAMEAMISDAPPARADLAGVYRLANEIFAEAGAFAQNELSAAAHSLCELTSPDHSGVRGWEPVRVHIASMRLLRSPALAEDERQRQALVAGLQKISSRAAV